MLKAGDLLRYMGTGDGGNAALGWLTNGNGNNGAKLTPLGGAQDKGIIAQCLEFDQGPVFDGFLEWVQPEDPREFEDDITFWRTGDSNRVMFRDPSVDGGFVNQNLADPTSVQGAYPYSEIWADATGVGQPELAAQPWKDAAGIPALTDGANWESIMRTVLGGFTKPAGQTSVTFVLYYHTYAGVGQALKPDHTALVTADAIGSYIFDSDALSGGLTLTQWMVFLDGTAVVASRSNDGKGTITITYTVAAAALVIPAKSFYFLAMGQVAGVPTNIDIARCIGLARFQLLVR